MKQRAYGFTIVELLIVIVVIAILAAISVAAYTDITDRANDSAIKSDLASFAKAAQVYHAENGVYPAANQLGLLNLRVTKNSYDTIGYNLYYCTDAIVNGGSYSKFGFAAKSKSGKNFYATSAGAGESSGGAMYAHHACGPIDVGQLSHNLTYAYNHTNTAWAAWTD